MVEKIVPGRLIVLSILLYIEIHFKECNVLKINKPSYSKSCRLQLINFSKYKDALEYNLNAVFSSLEYSS